MVFICFLLVVLFFLVWPVYFWRLWLETAGRGLLRAMSEVKQNSVFPFPVSQPQANRLVLEGAGKPAAGSLHAHKVLRQGLSFKGEIHHPFLWFEHKWCSRGFQSTKLILLEHKNTHEKEKYFFNRREIWQVRLIMYTFNTSLIMYTFHTWYIPCSRVLPPLSFLVF